MFFCFYPTKLAFSCYPKDKQFSNHILLCKEYIILRGQQGTLDYEWL